MMLSVALNTMIDNCEALLFINTPNSITPANLNNAIKSKSKTLSPWIYYELSISRFIRRKSLEEHRPKELMRKSFSRELFQENLKITHEVDTSHLKTINIQQFNKIFKDKVLDKYEALDKIYDCLV